MQCFSSLTSAGEKRGRPSNPGIADGYSLVIHGDILRNLTNHSHPSLIPKYPKSAKIHPIRSGTVTNNHQN